ncbi:DNA primase [Sphingomonas sp.]|uniref:DNA primase n=1 Tax=Sphingomonas sp. TaxID=28214 RepID=UPI0035C7B686
MGGHQVESHGSGDDGYDEDGYDESQRAEILEATRNGPSDGTVLVDLDPDLGLDEEDLDDEDELAMQDGEVGVETSGDDLDDEDLEENDMDEDDAQEDFEDGDADDDLDDEDDAALRP